MKHRARGGSRAPTCLLAALLLLTGCSATSNPTVAPDSSIGTSTTAGAPSRSAGPPAPGTTTGAPTTSQPGASSGTRVSPEPADTPGSSASAIPASSKTPTATAASGETLPDCAYRDLPARGDPDRDWATLVLDTIYRLPADFVPERLVSTAKAGMNGGLEVIPAVVPDLRAMHDASLDDDAEIAVRWAYRSYAEQAAVFAYWVRTSGKQEALRLSARPGHSEHQLGTAVDFRSADSDLPPWDYDDWGATASGAWMAANAWRFGFVLSYPKGEQMETCYGYEPWHYRYVGRDIARDVHQSGETLRRYLWEHYEASQ